MFEEKLSSGGTRCRHGNTEFQETLAACFLHLETPGLPACYPLKIFLPHALQKSVLIHITNKYEVLYFFNFVLILRQLFVSVLTFSSFLLAWDEETYLSLLEKLFSF